MSSVGIILGGMSWVSAIIVCIIFSAITCPDLQKWIRTKTSEIFGPCKKNPVQIIIKLIATALCLVNLTNCELSPVYTS